MSSEPSSWGEIALFYCFAWKWEIPFLPWGKAVFWPPSRNTQMLAHCTSPRSLNLGTTCKINESQGFQLHGDINHDPDLQDRPNVSKMYSSQLLFRSQGNLRSKAWKYGCFSHSAVRGGPKLARLPRVTREKSYGSTGLLIPGPICWSYPIALHQ